MKTKEEFFEFEREKQKIFDEFYKDNGWPYKRIFGKDNKKYDCVVLINGDWIKIEEKFRSRDWPDLLVETIQDTETNDPGWLYYTEAELLLYGMDKKIYKIDIQKLKEFVDNYKDKFNEIISEKGWGITKNLVIPLSIIFINGLGERIQ